MLRATIDYQAIRAAIKSVEKSFPDFQNVRDAVAHAADKAKTPSKLEEHGFSGTHVSPGFLIQNAVGLTLSNGFTDRVYMNSEVLPANRTVT